MLIFTPDCTELRIQEQFISGTIYFRSNLLSVAIYFQERFNDQSRMVESRNTLVFKTTALASTAQSTFRFRNNQTSKPEIMDSQSSQEPPVEPQMPSTQEQSDPQAPQDLRNPPTSRGRAPRPAPRRVVLRLTEQPYRRYLWLHLTPHCTAARIRMFSTLTSLNGSVIQEFLIEWEYEQAVCGWTWETLEMVFQHQPGLVASFMLTFATNRPSAQSGTSTRSSAHAQNY